MLDFITHAASDDHINDARFDKFEEALDQSIICRAVTVECIGVATNVAATRIDRALRNGPNIVWAQVPTTLLEPEVIGRVFSRTSRFVPHIIPRKRLIVGESWSEWQDLNLRPPRPERGGGPAEFASAFASELFNTRPYEDV